MKIYICYFIGYEGCSAPIVSYLTESEAVAWVERTPDNWGNTPDYGEYEIGVEQE